MYYSLIVLGSIENQEVQKKRNLTWKKNEVLAWHIPLPDMAHFLFSSKMKPCYIVPRRKSSRNKQIIIVNNSEQFS
jgi:hypothetical protein